MYDFFADWLRAYEMWMDNPLVNVDGEAIERSVNEMYKTMQKSIRIFADIPAVQSVATEIRDQIERFKPLIPLIQSVRNPGMRQRHWDNLKEETGRNLGRVTNSIVFGITVLMRMRNNYIQKSCNALKVMRAVGKLSKHRNPISCDFRVVSLLQ